MSVKQRWLLPEGIDELLPEQAAQLETLRRQLLDMMQSWGYQLVFPPLVEYLDSLLTGTAKTLDLQTFKLTDQLSGRLMGIRADMTPQVARIAAHTLREQQGPLRLCYIGNVLQTLPNSQGGSRNPVQLGAEIYGHTGSASDMEIIELMVEVLNTVSANDHLLLDLGHVGIYRGLAEHTGLNQEQEQELFIALQRKALPDIELLLSSYGLAKENHDMLLALSELNGDVSVLDKAKHVLANAPEQVQQALLSLEKVAQLTAQRLPDVTLNFDLAELRGYDYHTGVVFAAYQAGSANAVAMGGRYDDIGKEFGHAQPATGFSIDLKKLVSQLAINTQSAKSPVLMPWSNAEQDKLKVKKLREQGEVVIYQFADSE
jgi:ATP phosphoribosyltransferase regulatory subunit